MLQLLFAFFTLLPTSLASCEVQVVCDGQVISTQEVPSECSQDTGLEPSTGDTAGPHTGDTAGPYQPVHAWPAGAPSGDWRWGVVFGQSWVAGTYHTANFDGCGQGATPATPTSPLWSHANRVLDYRNPEGVISGMSYGPASDPNLSIWFFGAGATSLDDWLYGNDNGLLLLDDFLHKWVIHTYLTKGYPGVPAWTVLDQGTTEAKTAAGVARRYSDLLELRKRQNAWAGPGHVLAIAETLCGTACPYVADLKAVDEQFAADHSDVVFIPRSVVLSTDDGGKHPANACEAWSAGQQTLQGMRLLGVIP